MTVKQKEVDPAMIVSVTHNGEVLCADLSKVTEAERQAMRAAIAPRLPAAMALLRQALEEKGIREAENLTMGEKPTEPTITDADVAQWMKDEFDKKDYCLYQEEVARGIVKKFGKQFTHQKENGNPAISKKVLKIFRRLTPDAVWSRGELGWMRRDPDDTSDSRMAD